MILTGRSLYIKCGYLIPPGASTNVPLCLITYISIIAYQHIPVGICDSMVVNIDISPNFTLCVKRNHAYFIYKHINM